MTLTCVCISFCINCLLRHFFSFLGGVWLSSEVEKENYGIGGILECVCVYAKKYIANERVSEKERGKNQLLIIEREKYCQNYQRYKKETEGICVCVCGI